MRITAADLLRLGVIDRIIYEPAGGAHRDHALTMRRTATAIGEELAPLVLRSRDALVAGRREKFLRLGRAL